MKWNRNLKKKKKTLALTPSLWHFWRCNRRGVFKCIVVFYVRVTEWFDRKTGLHTQNAGVPIFIAFSIFKMKIAQNGCELKSHFNHI